MDMDLNGAGAAIIAIGALGTAAFGLVDAFKAFAGGVSNVGWGPVKASLKPFAPALDATGVDWQATLKANWLNGMAKDDQKAAAKSLVRLGLSAKNAAAMAVPGRVDPARLAAVMTAVESGTTLSPEDVALLARFDSVIGAALDAGFENGDRHYRNTARFLAGVVAVLLSLTMEYLFPNLLGKDRYDAALLIGLVAVPIAPIAKDLSSALNATATAFRAARA
jgi:hypothetical protein